MRKSLRLTVTASLAAAALMSAGLAGPTLLAAPRDTYQVNALVSDGSQAESIDPNLKNAWGIAATPTSPWWVSSNLPNLATIYNGAGVAQQLVVQIPGSPTGIVANPDPDNTFLVTDGVNTGSSIFIFATLEGRIVGWNPGVGTGSPSTTAFEIIDRSNLGAVYTGLAAATTVSGDRLYAADFHNARIDVFDGTLAPVLEPGAFVDPKLPSGYAPFNVQVLNGRVFVAYAKVDPGTGEELTGQGLGIVDVYETDGDFLARVGAHGQLNAPWGMAIAPEGFGKYSGNLLVGNFGDGRIQAFKMSDDLQSFSPSGVLRDETNKQIAIDGLWGIGFGNGTQSGLQTTLYFAAGPNDETAGLFGSIELTP
jgi:uncharacterized protein (TIGR03118 family)